jgi:hypothetical protein
MPDPRARSAFTRATKDGGEVDRRLLATAGPLVSESQALSYVLVMALASTPREALSRKEIDALCQVAYELQNKLTEALEFFQMIEAASDPLSHEAER